jgi:hypothetical protein
MRRVFGIDCEIDSAVAHCGAQWPRVPGVESKISMRHE